MKRIVPAFFFALLITTLAETALVSVVTANPVPPRTVIEILSPQKNETYLASNVSLNFTVVTLMGTWADYISIPSIQCHVDRKLYQQINSTESLEFGQTRTFSIKLSGLSPGQHNVFITQNASFNLILANYSERASSKLVNFYVDHSPPRISVMSPKPQSYKTANISLNFTVCVDYGAVSWIGYSLDGQDNVTITGNATLTGLSEGAHNIRFYATDIYGDTGASEPITFTTEPQPFPTALVITASGTSVAIIGIGLLVYFKKRKQ